jgi:hypothetical protein
MEFERSVCPLGARESLPAQLRETFILDIPPSEEELHHIGVVFDLASRAAGVRLLQKEPLSALARPKTMKIGS